MSPEHIVTVAVASPDDRAILKFLSELWMAGASQLAAPNLQGSEIPLAGRGASTEREGVRFVVRAVGSGPPHIRRDVLELANVVLLLSAQDESLNARYREALGEELRAIHRHDGVTVEKYLIHRGTSALSCLDALARRAERRATIEASPTLKVDLATIDGLRQMTAAPVDPSDAPTEHVNLAEIVTFQPSRAPAEPVALKGAAPKRPAAKTARPKRRPAKGKKAAKKTRAKARKPAKKKRAKARKPAKKKSWR